MPRVAWSADTGAADTAGALATAASGGEVIYRQQLRVAADGAASVTSSGSNVVTLRDGTPFTVTFGALTDPDGGRYEIIGSTSQAEEGADVVSDLQVVRIDPVVLSEDELLAAWLDVHPDATVAEQDAFVARRSAAATLPAATTFVDDAVTDWLSTARATDTMDIRVMLADQPALGLPDIGPGLMDTDPAFVLDRLEARTLAIEARKTVIDASQADLVARAEAAGARVLSRTWLVNAIDLSAPPAVVEALAASTDVARIEQLTTPLYLADNRGEEIRDASQITQYLDNGLDGEQGSGRSTVDDIFVGVIDSKVDVDHPAWKDCGPPLSCGGRRLTDQWVWDGSAWVSDPVGTTTTAKQHGNWVAGQLIADLTDLQDSSVTTPTERKARTGMTTESSFAAIDSGSGGIDAAMDYAVDLNVDIVNLSAGCGLCIRCAPVHTRNILANDLYHAGIFFVHAAGNEGHSGSTGTVWPPSPAAGTFSVGGYDHTASNLNTGSIWGNSSRGGGVDDNAIIDLTAAGGRSAGLVEYNDSYAGSGHTGTSFAAPVVAGAAANLKHHLIDRYGAAVANDVGLIHAFMLLMGDGQLESGAKGYGAPVDTLWGAGRIRMRMFNAAGMDAPWRVDWRAWTVADGETWTAPLNPDTAGANQDIPLAVDLFKAAVWWYEPNLNYSGASVSEMRTRICQDGGLCTNHASTAPDAHRLQLDTGDLLPGNKWHIDVTGLDIPSNADPSDHYGEQKRDVFVAFYWEDRDRDDADGPDTGIQ